MIKFSKDKVLLLHKLIAQETGGSPVGFPIPDRLCRL